MSWNDFNTAENQTFDLIPQGIFVKVCMTIKPGGFNDATKGWTGGWATQNNDTGSVYLNCEFTVLEGKYVKRKIWSLIGLQSPKGTDWGNMGRAMIKGILNSARGFCSEDMSPAAQKARYIATIDELNGLECVVRVDVEKDGKGNDRNVIKVIIPPEHKEYAALMGRPRVAAAFPPQNHFQQSSWQGQSPSGQSPSGLSSSGLSPSAPNASNVPHWAK